MAKKKSRAAKPARAKSRSASRPASKAEQELRPGDFVRVRPGVRDPDFDDCVIGGWTGRVMDTGEGEDGETLFRVKWTKETLDQLTPAFKKRCKNEGYSIGEMDLDQPSLLAIAGPAPVEDAALSDDDQDDRIRKALGLRSGEDHPEVDEDTLLTYFKYLEEHLTFPFDAVHRDESGDWGSRTTRVTVMGLLGPDESPEFDAGYGLFCVIKSKGQGSGEVPLADIDVKKTLPQHRQVHDYAIWFANNR